MKYVHFIGIGGISMSALAQILTKRNYKVSGSDMNRSETTDKLSKLNVEIFIGHSSQNITNPDIIVYTAAISEDNPELKAARKLAKENPNVTVIDRATLLGKIMQEFKYSICVAGTHGKTTTTSMLAHIMIDTLKDPTIHVGGILDLIDGNVRTGSGEFFVTEACEYVESFLKFFPYVGIILNVEADHLDYYKDLNHIKSSFNKFVKLIPNDGFVVANGDNQNSLDVIHDVNCTKLTFGIESNSSYKADNIKVNDLGNYSFDVLENGVNIGAVMLSVPGKHNVYNSLSAIATARIFNLNFEQIASALNKFRGTHRRFEFKGYCNEAYIIDDYAHHPTEIKALLMAAKEHKHNKLIAVFQPHTYTRTKTLLKDFSEAFDGIDEVIITDIYAAREKDTGLIHSRDLVKLIEERGVNVKYIAYFDEIKDYLKNTLNKNDLCLTVGAGNIYSIGEEIVGK